MTGLDPQTDTILSISVLITTADLVPVEAHGLTLYITHTESQLSAMSEWCITTHTSTGLTNLCLDPTISTTAAFASAQVLEYIQRHIPTPRTALLAGNSIHADRSFLMVPPWNAILTHLHYRLFDVSAMKEMVRRWAPEHVLAAAPVKMLRHSAREDVLESIDEARFYMALIKSIALPLPPLSSPPSSRAVLTSVPFSADDPPAPEPANSLLDTNSNANTGTSTSSGIQIPGLSSSSSRFRTLETERHSNREPQHQQQQQQKRQRIYDDGTNEQGFRTDVP